MLWVCLKNLVWLTVGVSIVVALGELSSGASTALSIAVAGIGFFLWFAAFGAVMDIAAMRNDMDDDLKGSAFGTNFSKAPFPVYFGLMSLVMLGTPVMLIIMLKS
ncbi:MAG: hypothetical protein EBS76_03020 [Actinobacteria bacterium]|nr:hypothetical protein [Actinomycetota bacterium]